ncbi:NAD(+) diphosphatase [Acuticoccus sp. MNP-M23]|uniref:NAD(+) diphosphatase n=1 Tax=Acuticoccus sp. MNP-M23 TaxID=3072793 RepID=UPI0028151883|nr:NAD(+) diphosphatase [Acuticoccus sp. MNP-M23]WMS41552.1 NAD(+) diphosphatase [Acuticoccus sp. MNP-M23]
MLTYPPRDHSAAIGFGDNRLDRMSERRDDAPFIESVRADPAGRTMLFHDDQLVTQEGEGHGALFTRDEAAALGGDWDSALFLGIGDDGPLFATPLPAAPDENRFIAHNLRALAVDGRLPSPLLGAAAQGRSILGWHATHGFCARCGAATTAGQAGMRRDCSNCGTHHFPRTDPVVIMLAVDGERCLLGRQARFLPGMYSSLAGFMEPGETIEAAVRREIWEEAGIKTSRVVYHASQPWPFPSSIMIGCFAQATSTVIEPRDPELEDVRWFDRADIGPMLDRTHATYGAPPAIAIAHHLLRAYAEHGAPVLDGADAQG